MLHYQIVWYDFYQTSVIDSYYINFNSYGLDNVDRSLRAATPYMHRLLANAYSLLVDVNTKLT